MRIMTLYYILKVRSVKDFLTVNFCLSTTWLSAANISSSTHVGSLEST